MSRQPPAAPSLREAWDAVEPFIDVPTHTIEAARAWDRWLAALASPDCSQSEYADRMERENPCPICAALASPEPDGGLDVERLAEAGGNVLDGRRIGSVRLFRNTITPDDWEAIADEYARLSGSAGDAPEPTE